MCKMWQMKTHTIIMMLTLLVTGLAIGCSAAPSAPIESTRLPLARANTPTPNIEATVEALVQEKLAEAIAKNLGEKNDEQNKLTGEIKTSEPPPPVDVPTMSEAEVFTRFSKEYIFKTLGKKNDELNRLKDKYSVTDPDCVSIYEEIPHNCDDFNFIYFRQAYLDMAWYMSIYRSRHEFTYEGKGTWLVTVYPEDGEMWAKTRAKNGWTDNPGHGEYPSSRFREPILEFWFFEAPDLEPTLIR
jgi:hypothetical protein